MIPILLLSSWWKVFAWKEGEWEGEDCCRVQSAHLTTGVRIIYHTHAGTGSRRCSIFKQFLGHWRMYWGSYKFSGQISFCDYLRQWEVDTSRQLNCNTVFSSHFICNKCISFHLVIFISFRTKIHGLFHFENVDTSGKENYLFPSTEDPCYDLKRKGVSRVFFKVKTYSNCNFWTLKVKHFRNWSHSRWKEM